MSSPGFIENHCERYYHGQYKAFIVENRLAAGADYGPRPDSQITRRDQPLRIGWIGMLRCKRSLDLLAGVADRLGDRVEIHLHGIPARNEIPVFEPIIEPRENMTYHGRYRAPEDLAKIYEKLDVVWAGDFMEAGESSVWLLPNRIYEGGYYGVPSIAPEGTQTAAWIHQKAVGLSAPESLEESLPELIADLERDRTILTTYRKALLSLPDDVFVQPPGFLSNILKGILGPKFA